LRKENMSESYTPTPAPEPEITEDEKLQAILAYVPILCLIPYSRSDRTAFVNRHVNLGMILFVIEVFALIMRYLRVIWDVIIFICIIAALTGIYHVVRGRTFHVPYLSDLLNKRK
jgi:hypothetical protein